MKNRVTSDHLYMMRRFIREHHHCDVSVRRDGLRVESNGRVPVYLKDRMLAPRHFLAWLLLPSYDLKRSYIKDVERGLDPPPPSNLQLPDPVCWGDLLHGLHKLGVDVTLNAGSGPDTTLDVSILWLRYSSRTHPDARLIGRIYLLNAGLEGVAGTKNPVLDDWDTLFPRQPNFNSSQLGFWTGFGLSLSSLNQVLHLLWKSNLTFEVEVPPEILRSLRDYESPVDRWRQRYHLFCEGRILEDPGDPPEDPYGESVARFLAQLPSRT